jgi:hypothetical protein
VQAPNYILSFRTRTAFFDNIMPSGLQNRVRHRVLQTAVRDVACATSRRVCCLGARRAPQHVAAAPAADPGRPTTPRDPVSTHVCVTAAQPLPYDVPQQVLVHQYNGSASDRDNNRTLLVSSLGVGNQFTTAYVNAGCVRRRSRRPRVAGQLPAAHCGEEQPQCGRQGFRVAAGRQRCAGSLAPYNTAIAPRPSTAPGPALFLDSSSDVSASNHLTAGAPRTAAAARASRWCP